MWPNSLPTSIMGRFVVDPGPTPWFASAHSARLRAPQGAQRARRKQQGAACPPRIAMNAQQLLAEISDYCRQTGLAESTFGRRAVNDGKLAARLRNGGRITTDTLDRIHDFMTAHPSAGERSTIIDRSRDGRAAPPTPPAPPAPSKPGDPQRNFRFFD